jgi:16S rRNA (guanine966-N2)-methyltransferase
MRIISGKYKGIHLYVPKDIRPTQDKVRKTLFDVLGDIQDLSFLELYAGSGAIGMEAASHGTASVVLVENNRQCLMIIKKNIELLKADIFQLFPKDAIPAIKYFYAQEDKFDIIFMDPPYYQETAKKTLQAITAHDILSPYGLIVVEHFKKDDLPDKIGDLALFKQVACSDTLLSFFRKEKSA